MGNKQLYLSGGSDKGIGYEVRCYINANGNVAFPSFMVDNENDREKDNMRDSDRLWVYRNIPSSIHWKTEIHHDWRDGGRVYLLTKEEHKKITTEERRRKWENGNLGK